MSGVRALTLALVALAAFGVGFLTGRSQSGNSIGTGGADGGRPALRVVSQRRTRAAETSRSAPDAPRAQPVVEVPSAASVPTNASLLLLLGDGRSAANPAPPRGVRVRGRCVDATGAPVRAAVHVLHGHAVSTDPEGRFELDGVPGSAASISFAPDQGRLAWLRVPLRAAVDGAIDQGDVVLHAGLTLRGRFLDFAGNAIAGTQVNLHISDAGWQTRTTTTDESGAFSFEHVGDGFCAVSGRSPGCRLTGVEHDAWVHLPQRDGRDVALRVLSEHFIRLAYVDETRTRTTLRSGSWRWYALDDPNDAAQGAWTDSQPCDGIRVPVRVGATYEVHVESDECLAVVQRFDAGEEYDRRVELMLRRPPR